MPVSAEELLAKAQQWRENAEQLVMAGHEALARDCQIEAVSYEKKAAEAS